MGTTIQFHQISLQYLPEEDRLLLLLNTSTKEQFRLLLTRRFTKLLWPLLNRVMVNDEKVAATDPQTKRVAAAFQHEKMMEGADYQEKFIQDNLTYPWGQEPILLMKIVLKPMANGKSGLGIYDKAGVGLEFTPDNKALHYIYSTLAKIVEKADWDLRLEELSLNELTGRDPSSLN